MEVVRGARRAVRIARREEICDRNVLFSLFTEAARAGIPLSRRTERAWIYETSGIAVKMRT